MKKYLLVSLTILFAATFLWAAEATMATPALDVEADATLSWGVELGTGNNAKATHGFKNEASFGVKFPLINKGDKTSAKSDVPVYGEINLTNIGLKLLSEKDNNAFRLAGQVEDIEAKLVFYGAYLTVYDSPDFRANYAQIWKPLRNNKYYKTGDYRIRPGFTGMGTKLGYTNKDFMGLDVGLKLGSNGPWDPELATDKKNTGYWKYFDGKTAVGKGESIHAGNITYGPGAFPPEGNYFVGKSAGTDDDPHSKYGIGIDFAIKPLDKMLGIALTVNSTFGEEYEEKHDGNVSFGVELKSEPVDSLKLKAAFDGGMGFKSGSKFVWDAIVTAEYKWVTGGVYLYSPNMSRAFVKSDGTYDFYSLNGYSFKAGEGITDFAFFLQFATKADKKDATNLVEGLDAGAHVAVYQLNTFLNKDKAKMQFPLLFTVWGSYQLNLNDSSWVKPFANVWAETNHGFNIVDDPKLALAYNLGVTYSPVEKVEVTAQWNHGKLWKNRYRSAIEVPMGFGKAGYHNGEFVLSLKLTY